MRPVIVGAIVGFILSAIFVWFNPGKGDYVTVIGLGTVFGAMFSFLMTNLLLPKIENDYLYVWIISIFLMAISIYIVWYNTNLFTLNTHLSIGAGAITAVIVMLGYYLGILEE